MKSVISTMKMSQATANFDPGIMAFLDSRSLQHLLLKYIVILISIIARCNASQQSEIELVLKFYSLSCITVSFFVALLMQRLVSLLNSYVCSETTISHQSVDTAIELVGGLESCVTTILNVLLHVFTNWKIRTKEWNEICRIQC